MKFICDHCGEVKSVIVDGYSFGERDFEGIDFTVSIADNDSLTIIFDPSHKEYLSKFNKERMFKQCEEHIRELAKQEEEIGPCIKCDEGFVVAKNES